MLLSTYHVNLHIKLRCGCTPTPKTLIVIPLLFSSAYQRHGSKISAKLKGDDSTNVPTLCNLNLRKPNVRILAHTWTLVMRLDFWDFLMVATILVYLFIAPYTKVEESFNIQAIHDVLFYGTDFAKYDHQEFPGVVPRTFVGAIALALLAKPIEYIGLASKFDLQIVSRAILGLANAYGLIKFRHSLVNKVTSDHGLRAILSHSMAILYLSQFHMLFYASRTLPNMVVLPLVTISYAWIIDDYTGWAISLLSFSSIVFRSELAVLTGCIALSFLVTRKIGFFKLIFAGLLGTAIGGALSFSIDSKLWDNNLSVDTQGFPMIPEVHGFIFNVINEQSSEWGVEPFTAYLLNHIPNILNNRFLPVLIPIAALYDKTESKNNLRLLTISSIAYVLIYSYLPHKEWRFIVYTIPVFTAACAGLLGSLNRGSPGWFLIIVHLVAITTLLGFGMTVVKVWSSSLNYPGGVALKEFHDLLRTENIYESGYPVHLINDPITVHMDVTTCMTGADRFGQLYDDAAKSLYPNLEPIIYDKSEKEEDLIAKWASFDYLITIADSDKKPITAAPGYQWKKLRSVQAFAGVNYQWAYSVFRMAKDRPELIIQIFMTADDWKAEIWRLISPTITTRDYIYIYKLVQEGKS